MFGSDEWDHRKKSVWNTLTLVENIIWKATWLTNLLYVTCDLKNVSKLPKIFFTPPQKKPWNYPFRCIIRSIRENIVWLYRFNWNIHPKLHHNQMEAESNRQRRRLTRAHSDQEFGEFYNGCLSCYHLPRTALMMKEYIWKKGRQKKLDISKRSCRWTFQKKCW